MDRYCKQLVDKIDVFFSPSQRGKKSVSNFDPEFTKEPCRLSPVDPTIIQAIEPQVFEGFSFTNPEMYHS